MIATSSIVNDAIKHIVKTYVITALNRLEKEFKRGFKLNIESVAVVFGDYIKRAIDKHSFVNTLVFNNQRKPIKDLYLPVTLTDDKSLKIKNKETVVIDEYPKSFMKDHKRLMITDFAGMGKSTLTKVMFLSAIDKEAGIPFYIELRNLTDKHLLLDEIRDQLSTLTSDFDDYLMRAFFQKGGFIFFFDGLDEIPLKGRKEVIKDIKGFINKAPDNTYIITSRPEQALLGFGDFYSFGICPLEKKDAYQLIRKYDPIGTISEKLIKRLENGYYEKIQDFLHNPLLVSLLYVGFEYKPDIPYKIHLFYNQVYEAYYNRFDLSKDGYFVREKRTGLDMADFEKLLRAFSYLCLIKYDLRFDRKDFISIITKAQKVSGIAIESPELMLDDLLHAVPFLFEDGLGYKWVHKSMAEYFAADFVFIDAQNNKERILKTLSKSSKLKNYVNFFSLYSDLDKYYYQKIVLLPAINDYIDFIKKPNRSLKIKNKEQLYIRRQIMYNLSSDLYFYPDKKETMAPSLSLIFKYRYFGIDYNDITFFFPMERSDILLLLNVPQFKDVISDYSDFQELLNVSTSKSLSSSVERKMSYLVDEEFLIDKPDDYCELNQKIIEVMFQYCLPFLSYKKAVELRDKINRMVRETDKEIDDLI